MEFEVGVIDLDTVVGQILAAPVAAQTRIVGVDGPAASGKTTFVRNLRGCLPEASLIEIDDFVSWSNDDGWWTRFLEQALVPIHNGERAHYQARDWVNDEFGTRLGEWRTVPWSPLVILDGGRSTRLDAQPFLSFSIWVEAPRAERLRRGMERDGESHRALWLRWMEKESRFFARDGTKDRADIRVDTSDAALQRNKELITIF
jgi:uridine kinase